MPYYVRVLSPSEGIIAASELARSVKDSSLTLEAGTDAQWEELLLAHPNGHEIAVVERNVVSPGSMAEEEINEFLEKLNDLRPTSGADWLRGYLPTIRTIYAFQVLSGTGDSRGWSELGSVKTKLWSQLGGIFQADGEGFSNNDGYHIVWQFSEGVAGPWWMGIVKDGTWVYFEMELGNLQQRVRGELPAGAAKLAS